MKEFNRGWVRILWIYLIAGVTSFVAVFALAEFVPSLVYLGFLIATIATYFAAKKFVPFSKYPETKNYKYGRWTGVAIWFVLMGQNIVHHFSVFIPPAGSHVAAGANATDALLLFVEVTILFALLAGYIGARDRKSVV